MLTSSLNFFSIDALRVWRLLFAIFAAALLFCDRASAQQTPKPVPGSSTNKFATTIVNTDSKVLDTAHVVAVAVGRSVQQPKELEQVVSQAGAIPGNRVNLATRVFKEASSKDCSTTAITSAVGATGNAVCALGKVVSADA